LWSVDLAMVAIFFTVIWKGFAVDETQSMFACLYVRA
jgi:hypothetical protein